MNGLPCQDAELKAEKHGGKYPLQTLEKLGCKKKEYIRYTWPLVSPGNVQQIMPYHNLAYAIMAV
jgi:hypothetical protein